jgi:uncharacterized protein (DUF1330 family)
MPAYMIVEIEVVDRSAYADYMERIPEVVAKYGGRYLVRSEAVLPLVGGWRPERLIVLEFPTLDAMTRWNFSPEYRELAPIRERATRTRAIAVEGCGPAGHGASL